MNQLDPELKRLLKWARPDSARKPEEAPFGFSGRVLSSVRPAAVPTLFHQMQRMAWGLSWVSLVLIVCGAVVLLSQRSAPPPTEELSSALSFLASNYTR